MQIMQILQIYVKSFILWVCLNHGGNAVSGGCLTGVFETDRTLISGLVRCQTAPRALLFKGIIDKCAVPPVTHKSLQQLP